MRLDRIMILNGISCLIFGGIFTFDTSKTIDLLGNIPHFTLQSLGIILLINAGHLFWAAIRKPHKFELLYFIFGDFLWFFLTTLLLISNTWITTSFGHFASSLTAIMVGMFGYGQLTHYRKIYRKKKGLQNV